MWFTTESIAVECFAGEFSDARHPVLNAGNMSFSLLHSGRKIVNPFRQIDEMIRHVHRGSHIDHVYRSRADQYDEDAWEDK